MLSTTCVAVALSCIAQRFPHVGFINPEFTELTDPAKRKTDASNWGALAADASYSMYAGVIHITGMHWDSFVLYPNGAPDCQDKGPNDPATAPTCLMYDCSQDTYSEMQSLVQEVFHGHFTEEMKFVRDHVPRIFDGSSCGLLSLLFVEQTLAGVQLFDESVKPALPYYRMRYLRLALNRLNETQ